jgi:hypothetical protein
MPFPPSRKYRVDIPFEYNDNLYFSEVPLFVIESDNRNPSIIGKLVAASYSNIKRRSGLSGILAVNDGGSVPFTADMRDKIMQGKYLIIARNTR